MALNKHGQPRFLQNSVRHKVLDVLARTPDVAMQKQDILNACVGGHPPSEVGNTFTEMVRRGEISRKDTGVFQIAEIGLALAHKYPLSKYPRTLAATDPAPVPEAVKPASEPVAPVDPDGWMTKQEVADYFGVNVTLLYQWARVP